jgi:hypothetical protein
LSVYGLCNLWNIAGACVTSFWIQLGITDTRFVLAFISIFLPTVIGCAALATAVTAAPLRGLLRQWPVLRGWQRALLLFWFSVAGGWLLLVFSFLTSMSSEPRLGLPF